MTRTHLSPSDIGNPALPTDNDYGIPVLNLACQATLVDLPFARWGRERRKSRMKGTWHFYVDDARFERLWERPTDLINSGCVSATECNFSVTEETPAAVAIYQTYRKRRLARIWQEVGGIRLLVDLNVHHSHARTNLLGVPRGWRSYCTRGSVTRLDDLQREYELACERAGTSEILFVVYGGGKAVKQMCLDRQWLHFIEEQDSLRASYGQESQQSTD